MAGYTRQSVFTDGNTGFSVLWNDEYDALLAAFNNSTGHAHDGTAAEGPVIGLIGDPGVTTPLNKVQIDNANNNVGVWVDVASASVEQLTFADGVVAPVTDSDVDWGTTGLRFKDGFIDSLTVTGLVSSATMTASGLITYASLVGASGATITGILDEDNMVSDSATHGATQQSIKKYVDDQQDTVDTWAEVLALGNSSGGTAVVVTAGDAFTVNVITETTAATGVTIDSVLLKDGGGTFTGTIVGPSGSWAATGIDLATTDSYFVDSNNVLSQTVLGATVLASSLTSLGTIASLVATTADINAGTVDAVIGGTTPAAGSFTTIGATGTITGPSGTWAATGIDLATTDSYFIASNNVLSQTVLGATVLASSLTSLGTIASLVATTADINAGTVDAIVGGTTPAAGTFTTVAANTSLVLASGATVTAILDEDNLVSDSATALATQQSIKAYVDGTGSGDVSKVGTPVDNQVGVWTGDGTIEGTTSFTFDGTDLQIGTGLELEGSGTHQKILAYDSGLICIVGNSGNVFNTGMQFFPGGVSGTSGGWTMTIAYDWLPNTTESFDIGSSALEVDNIFLQNAATVSDENRKNFIGGIENASEFLNFLNPQWFTYTNLTVPAIKEVLNEDGSIKHPAVDEREIVHSRPHTGFGAQSVKKAMTDAGYKDWAGYAYDDETDVHMLRLMEFTAFLVKGHQEHTLQISELKAQIQELSK